MKIINLSQRDEIWLGWRREGITATDASVLLNRSPYKTVWRLWAEKTGFATEVDLSMNPLVRQGVQNEDLARQAFEARHDELLLPVCVESSTDSRFRASLDGLTSNDIPVELKCPSGKVWEEVCSGGTNSDPYQLYYPQVQHQILVTGAPGGWLVFFYEGSIKEFYITRDETLLARLKRRAETFWQQVVDRKEPEKDPFRDLFIPTDDQAFHWIAAANEYKALDAEIQSLKSRLEELKRQQEPHLETMKSLMGTYYHADYGGVMITRYQVSGKVDYNKLLEDKAAGITTDDLDSYRAPTTERYRTTVTESDKPRNIADETVLQPIRDAPKPIKSSYF